MKVNVMTKQLRNLKLLGMAGGLQQLFTTAGMSGIGVEERLALLVDRQVYLRNDWRQACSPVRQPTRRRMASNPPSQSIRTFRYQSGRGATLVPI